MDFAEVYKYVTAFLLDWERQIARITSMGKGGGKGGMARTKQTARMLGPGEVMPRAAIDWRKARDKAMLLAQASKPAEGCDDDSDEEELGTKRKASKPAEVCDDDSDEEELGTKRKASKPAEVCDDDSDEEELGTKRKASKPAEVCDDDSDEELGTKRKASKPAEEGGSKRKASKPTEKDGSKRKVSKGGSKRKVCKSAENFKCDEGVEAFVVPLVPWEEPSVTFTDTSTQSFSFYNSSTPPLPSSPSPLVPWEEPSVTFTDTSKESFSLYRSYTPPAPYSPSPLVVEKRSPPLVPSLPSSSPSLFVEKKLGVMNLTPSPSRSLLVSPILTFSKGFDSIESSLPPLLLSKDPPLLKDESKVSDSMESSLPPLLLSKDPPLLKDESKVSDSMESSLPPLPKDESKVEEVCDHDTESDSELERE
jgi:hypothetical protein